MSEKSRLPAAAVAACVALGLTAAAPAAFAASAFTVRARDAAGNVSTASPARTVTTPPGGGGGGDCTATYLVTNTWSGGFQGEVTVVSAGAAAIAGWRVTWTDPGGTVISSLWNGRWTVTDGANVVLNESYNGQLAPGSSTTFGFTGTGTGVTPVGLTCSAP